MKQTEMQRVRERIVLFFFAVLSVVFINGIFVHAAEKVIYETGDFSVKAVEETADSCKIVVTPKVSIDWIIIHLGDQNVGMKEDGNDFSYQVTTASQGATVDISFTYFSDVAHDSEPFSYTVGSAYAEGGSGNNNGDNNNNDDNNNNNGGDDNNNNTPSNPRIEAENYTAMSGVDKDNGQITNLDVNDWMRYSLDIPTAGNYRIVVRGKSENKDGILVFRDAAKRIGTVKLTGNGQTAEYKSEDTIQLQDGNLKLTVIVVSGKISADWIEFEPADSGNGDNQGGGDTDPDTDPDPDYVNPDVETTPDEDTTIPEKKDKMIFQFNNVTNGAYKDNEIYWCALGYKPGSGELCYINAEGEMIPVNPDMNTLQVGDRKVANIFNTLSQNKYVYMPSVVSGRMYISYGSPVYITINETPDGVIGFAGPDMNNPTDPNQDVYFEFMEFTIGLYGAAHDEPTHYWGNTTRVDNFCFPVVSRLIGENNHYDGNAAEPYDKTVGDVGGRDKIRREFVEGAPAEFKEGLVDDCRIFAPCKRTFNEGQVNANFYQSTIDAFWKKYAEEDLIVNCEGGNFVGRTEGNRLRFTTTIEGQEVTGYIDKPTTQDVLEGKGAFDRRSLPYTDGDSIEYKIGSKELVLEAQLCAAFNRGLALQDPSTWSHVEEYYKYYPYNYYSKFWHEHSFDNKGYGFCYDDVYDQSTLLECNTAKKLVIDLKWN